MTNSNCWYKQCISIFFKARGLLAVVLTALGWSVALPVQATPYDHIHLAAPDTEQASNWYARHFGGRASRFRDSTDTALPIDRVMFDNIAVVFFEREPGEGSVGSGVDHISFSMSNVEQVMDAVIADGATGLGDLVSFGGMTIGFIEDPWGTKIELIDDTDLRGMHHVHLSTPDPAGTLQWYLDTFGGESAQFAGALPGVHYGNIWVLADQSSGDVEPTQGRSLDHLGWNFSDLDAAAVEMKAKGVEFTMEPRDYRGIRISFVEGPDAVRIEVVQP